MFEKHIIIECKRADNGQRCTMGYEAFNELKEEVIKKLDSKGWDDKNKVDLRKVENCVQYILEGKFTDITVNLTSSFSKFIDYRYGTRGVIV